MVHNKFNLWRVNYKCSYCEELMLFTSKKVKRPVPQGAKDLNIYDEIGCWECSNCKQTSTDFITDCNRCGEKVLNIEADSLDNNHHKLSPELITGDYPEGDPGIYGYLKNIGNFRNPVYPAQCMNCVTCDECNQKILDNSAQSQKFDELLFIDDDRGYRCFFLHKSCVEQSQAYKTYENYWQQSKYNKGTGCANSIIAVIGLTVITLTFLIVGVIAVFLPVQF